MANETNNLMQELDAQVIAEFEASLSEEAKADWSKAIESCGGDSKKIAEVTSNYRNSAYVYVSSKVEYACEQSGAGDKHQTAYNFAQQKETERDRILYGEGYGNAFEENVTGLDDVVGKDGKVERKGLRTQYAEAEAGNNTTLMEALSEQIKAREAELEKVNNELAYWQAEDSRAYQQLESRDNRLDLLRAVQNGDQEAAKAAMLKEIEAFDNAGTPSINSADDATKWQSKCDEINKYKEYLDIEPEKAAEIQETAEVETTNYNGQLSDNTQTIGSEKPNPYKFNIPRPEDVSQAAYDNGWRAEQERQLRHELDEQKAAEVMNADGSIDADKLNKLSNQGYNVDSIRSIVDEKNKEKEGVSAKGQIVETAEAAESEAKGAAPAEEKPNPYAFEKPTQEPNEDDDAYKNRCALAEAEHIDNVNRQAAADINAGKYGNGEDRKKALAEAGLDYDAVQSIINNEYAPKYEAERAKQAEAAAKQAAAGPSDADIDAALAEAENNNKKIEIKTEASVKDEVEAIKADVTATFDAQRTPLGEAQAAAKVLERKAQEGRPLTDEELEEYKNGSVAEMGDDFSFEPKDDEPKANKDNIPGVEYDENGEAVVIHGDEPVSAKPKSKVVVKDFSGGTNLYNGSQSGDKSAEFENQP